ncbi:hypothetical protein [Microbacterium indicum]|uniref:hypothetical protein n=1 Tax=Microbacterium indicum TaxID=358100 RepID=UPI00040EDD84|nr:hypothetical protein [Microbacterium indicum]
MTDQPLPPVPPHPEPPRQAPSSNARLGSRALAVTVSVLGGIALVVPAAGTAFATVASASFDRSRDTVSADAAGVDLVDLTVPAGSMTVRFDDVDEVTLDAPSAARWSLVRDGSSLVVDRGNLTSLFGIGAWGDDGNAILTLPRSLEGVDLDVDLLAGGADIEGDFGAVVSEVDAGFLDIEGSADTVEARMSAGGSSYDLADVQSASFDISAGGVSADFTGEAPEAVDVTLSAGSLDLTVPDETYAVTTSGDFGDVDNGLDTDPSAPRTIDVTTDAGSVSLSAG